MAVQANLAEHTVIDPEAIMVEPPDLGAGSSQHHGHVLTPSITDFVALEGHNRQLGYCGEKFVMEFEKARLNLGGHDDLAKEVEWVSQTKGDGAGYDVASFDSPDERRFIEVKTTNYGRGFPFYISRNELEFSKDHADHYQLYRVFHYNHRPRLFMLGGAVETHCIVEPETFKAGFGREVA